MKGWIYILSNQSVPDWLAIGCADTDPATLVHQYGNSGIKLPYPFELQYALCTPYAQTSLKKIHEALAEHCINPEHNQDWFECDLRQALRLVRQIAGNSATGEAFYAQARQLVEQARLQKQTQLAPEDTNEPTSIVQQIRTTPELQRGKRPAPLVPNAPRPTPVAEEAAPPPKEEPKWLITALIVFWVILMMILVFLVTYTFGYI